MKKDPVTVGRRQLSVGSIIQLNARQGEPFLPITSYQRIGSIDLFGNVKILEPADEMIELRPQDYSLITTTETWLIRLGYLEIPDFYIANNLKFWYHPATTLYELMHTTQSEPGLKLEAYRGERSNSFQLISEPLLYVHQLQNLHSALTHTELEVDLSA